MRRKGGKRTRGGKGVTVCRDCLSVGRLDWGRSVTLCFASTNDTASLTSLGRQQMVEAATTQISPCRCLAGLLVRFGIDGNKFQLHRPTSPFSGHHQRHSIISLHALFRRVMLWQQQPQHKKNTHCFIVLLPF